MGLRVENNLVIVDHDSREHLITGVEGNPAEDQIGAIKVFSVFTRRTVSMKNARKRQGRSIGDNCPLIYALKGKEGLEVEFRSIKLLNSNIPKIIERIVQKIGGEFELIISMPSSSNLASILGRRLSRALGSIHVSDVFSKTTNAQAMAEILVTLQVNPRTLPRDDVRLLTNSIQRILHNPEMKYESKNIPTKVRRFFQPLNFVSVPSVIDKKSNILLVDDLISSGETISAACELLGNAGFCGRKIAVTWFSRI